VNRLVECAITLLAGLFITLFWVIFGGVIGAMSGNGNAVAGGAFAGFIVGMFGCAFVMWWPTSRRH